VEAQIARLVQLGATRIEDKNEFGYTWTLMADPEGNEFDIGKAH
jgi:Glyoxalase-like domain